jgi:hypothetical protein
MLKRFFTLVFLALAIFSWWEIPAQAAFLQGNNKPTISTGDGSTTTTIHTSKQKVKTQLLHLNQNLLAPGTCA